MPVESKTVPVGAEAPDFTLTAIDGREITLSGLRGKPVVLVFLRGFIWPFCRRHLSQLRDRYGEFDERGAQLLAIAPDTLENARRYFETNDIPFPSLPDPDREVFRQYDVKSAMVSLGQRPGLFVVDKDGIVRYAHLGWQQWEIPTVDETLAQLDALSLRYPIFVFDGDDMMVYETPEAHWNDLESYDIDSSETLSDSEGHILTKIAAEKDRVRLTNSGADPDPQRLREMLLHALRKRGEDLDNNASLESLIALAQATER